MRRVPFRGKIEREPPPASPEALYRDLPRKPGAVPGLWLHQGDLLRPSTGAVSLPFLPSVATARHRAR